MSRLDFLLCCLVAVGATLLFSELRWFRRRRLSDRLARFVPGGGSLVERSGTWSVDSFRDVLGPLASELGARAARLAGVTEDLSRRLERLQADVDPTTFRVRQLGWCLAAAGMMASFCVLADAPGVMTLMLVAGAACFAFLVVEQNLSARSSSRREVLMYELPVVAEQLGMLLGAGYSLGSALGRLATRGSGVCGDELRAVCGRIRQGLDEPAALREWAQRADLDALHRLVGVLALNRDAGDVGRLVGEEARAIRRELHRNLIEKMERRGQQVWIPVTVATLVPGVIFLSVPFVEALRIYSSA